MYRLTGCQPHGPWPRPHAQERRQLSGLDARDAPAVSAKLSVAKGRRLGFAVVPQTRRQWLPWQLWCREHPTLKGTEACTGNVKLGSEGNDAILLADHGVEKGHAGSAEAAQEHLQVRCAPFP